MIPLFLCPLLKLIIATSNVIDSSSEQLVSISTSGVDNSNQNDGIVNGEGKSKENKDNSPNTINSDLESGKNEITLPYRSNERISNEYFLIHSAKDVSNIKFSITDHILTSLKAIHGHVMTILKLPVIENTFFHFNNVNFANQLESELSPERIESVKRRFFLFDVQRLVFTWMIYMRQKFTDNDQTFERVIKDVESINSKVLKNELRVPCDFFKLKSIMDDWSKLHFHELLKVEFLENHSRILPTFISIIKAFYDNNSNQKMSCLEFKTNYFNGNYIKRSILMYWIVIYDPQGTMRSCITNEIDHSKRLNYKEKISINKCIKILSIRKINSFESFKVQYLTRSISGFFLRFNGRFPARNHRQLSVFLDRLDEIGLLKKEILERLIGFERIDGSFEWDQIKFRRMVLEHMTCYNPFRLRNMRSKKYFQLFNATGELHEKVMKRLQTFESDNSKIIFFDSGDFPDQLYSLLKERKESDLIPAQDPFWHHLSRLLFKWIIRMKQLTDYDFECSLKDIQPIASKVNEMIGNNLNVVLSLDLKSIITNERKEGERVQIATFKELMACELAEDSHTLEEFAEILQRYYQLQNLDCEELKSHYFNDEFDSDQLLKFLIVLYDPLEVLRSKCLADQIPPSITTLNNLKLGKLYFVTKERFDNYLVEIRKFQEPRDLEISNMNHVTTFMIKSFLNYGKKFQIWDQSNQLILLKELKKIVNFKLISGEFLLNLIEFKSNSPIRNDHLSLSISL